MVGRWVVRFWRDKAGYRLSWKKAVWRMPCGRLGWTELYSDCRYSRRQRYTTFLTMRHALSDHSTILYLAVASTELPPQMSPDFVPPMLLHSSSSAAPSPQPGSFQQQNTFLSNSHMQNAHNNAQHMIPSAPHSAPANIVFQNIHGHLTAGSAGVHSSGSSMNSPYGTLPSPAEMEFDDLSPLTSPWLGAYNSATGTPSSSTGQPIHPHSQQVQGQGPADNNVLPSTGASAGMKRRNRTSSPPSDNIPEGSNPRGRSTKKRQPTFARMTAPNTQTGKKTNNALRGGTKSANSTPMFPATIAPSSSHRPNTRRSIGGPDIPGDSPSPVDLTLSMPPPATPNPPLQGQIDFLLNPVANAAPLEQQQEAHPILPVTPASIMNLGRLGTQSSLAPPSTKAPKKAPARPRSATVNTNANGNVTAEKTPLVSPALKPIRPGMFSLFTVVLTIFDLLQSSGNIHIWRAGLYLSADTIWVQWRWPGARSTPASPNPEDLAQGRRAEAQRLSEDVV